MKEQRSSSGFWRLAAVLLLTVTGIPALWSMRPELGSPTSATAEPGPGWDVPGEIVVETRAPESQQEIAALSAAYGAAFAPVEAASSSSRILRVTTTPALAGGLLARLRNDSRVGAAEPEHLVRAFWKPNDPRYSEQWNFQRIHMEKAWDVTKGKGAVVAVIDTGVAFEQDAKCYLARDFKNTRFTKPYDFVSRDKHPTDDNGHGTHVAGTIAESTDNGEGVAGIAFEAAVMPLKVLRSDGSGRMSDVAAAIRYAAENGANVINMSLGAPFGDSITRNACKYARDKGVTIVCAAGNSASEGVGYPAAYPECIAVSALGPTGELAYYSSWGKEVAIAAPGGDKNYGEDKGILQNTVIRSGSGAEAESNVVSNDERGSRSNDPYYYSDESHVRRTFGGEPDFTITRLGDRYPPWPEAVKDDYFYFQGTSMASPHVAGVAALVVSLGVKDPGEVKSILQKSAQKRGPKEKYGAGELDAAGAVKLAKGTEVLHVGRLWIIGGLCAWSLLVGVVSRRGFRSGAAAGVFAVSLGLLLPEVITQLAGFDSAWNLFGHSVLLPGYILLAEAESRPERKFFSLLTAGLALHLSMDLLFGLSPIAGPSDGPVLPWLWANVAVGAGALVSALRR